VLHPSVNVSTILSQTRPVLKATCACTGYYDEIYSGHLGFYVSSRWEVMERRERAFRFRNIDALKEWHHKHDMAQVSILSHDLGRMLTPDEQLEAPSDSDGSNASQSDESSESSHHDRSGVDEE
jgi:hypothetical protein